MPTNMLMDEDGNRYILVPIRQKKEMVGREYVMQRLGIGKAQLSRSPWNLPDFGMKVKGHKGIKPYTKDEVDEWLTIPARRRREMYKEWKGDVDADK